MVRILIALTLLMFTLPGQTDVLLIEQVRQAGNMSVPENGQTKAEVEHSFGEPESRSSPVGDPPISMWKYAGWSVYFEYNLVLFTVLDKGVVVEKEASEN
jgi:hypothetical protein